jgi:tRNA U34 5-methylaminomethyl-2-thiouridine-forming methyltransferase MnmC
MKNVVTPPGIEFKLTGDGSHTLFVPSLNEHYHSTFGAIAESRHIFINAGLNFVRQSSSSVKILEIGFGTGLNAFLTFIETIDQELKIDYTAIELYPLKEEIYSRLNYPEHFYSNRYTKGTPTTKAVGSELVTNYQPTTLVVGDAKNTASAKTSLHLAMKFTNEMIKEVFLKMHTCSWNEGSVLSDKFSLTKIHTSLEDYLPEYQYFDLIYFDAFGPDVQPELWTSEVFNKMAACLKPGGVLVTYSTKGTVRRNLKEAGFRIEKLPGPVGKREILRGIL